MIGKMIGALVGGNIAKNANTSIGGPTGAAIGAAVPFILSRMSLPTMIAMGVGGYAVKKYLERNESTRTDAPANNVTKTPSRPASIPQPAAAA